jgi:alkylation response protein AidB-like acyl-CoA dehydrogenase
MDCVKSASIIGKQIEAAPCIAQLRALHESDFAPEIVAAILEEAGKFAARHLAPLDPIVDRRGCRIEAGRVRTAPGHREAWEAFIAGGWPTIDQPEAQGGQGLPLVIWAACQELFDRGCVAFGMTPGSQRAAAKLIDAWGDDATKAEWLPHLVGGDWAATICISEPDAGSDVGRIRTRAEPNGDGSWSVTGEKIWISFGDHDLAPRIGHCLLARTPDAPPGGAGLSLFLAPDTLIAPDGSAVRNAVFVRRIEEKMGLHGSPTCALGFEGARAALIGTPGRGLAQMFVMITNMRLSVGVQGLGIAAGAADCAIAYARDRRQGGRPDRPPVAIAEHPDVQRMLLGMAARVETLRGLVLATAIQADLAQSETDPAARDAALALTQFLLPIVKTTGGEVAFEVASEAMQVFGGAGYTADWPIEQALRDARVLTIYEGATGIQALDLLHRRIWRDGGAGLRAFMALARPDIAACGGAEGEQAARCLDLLEDAAAGLAAMSGRARDAEAGATAFLHLAALAATAWMAARFAMLPEADPDHARLAAAGRFWLSGLAARASSLHAEALAGARRLDGIDRILADSA